MSSSRVVRVRPADDRVVGRAADPARRHRRDPGRARGESGVPAGGRGGRRGGGREPAAARPRPHRPADGDDRPGGRRWTSTRRCTSRAPTTAATCSTTRSPTSRRSSRPATRSTSRRTGAARRSTARTAAIPLHPTVDLRGRRLAAARPGPARPALDDHHRRRGRAHRRRGGAGAGQVPGPARLPGRAEAHRRRHRRRVPDAAQGGRASSGSSARRPAAASRCRCRSRRSTPPGRQWELEFRDLLPVEEWNAQMSLLTGFAAASLMMYARVGLPAHAARRRPRATSSGCTAPRTRSASSGRPSCCTPTSSAASTRPSRSTPR